MDTAVDVPSHEAWTECRECIPDVKIMASEAVRRFHREHRTDHAKTITMEWPDLLKKIQQLKDTNPREWKGTFFDKRNLLNNYLRDGDVYFNHIGWPDYIRELKPFLQTWTVQLKKTTHLCQHLLFDGRCSRQECDFQHPAAFLSRENFDKLLQHLTQDELSRTVLPAHTIAKFFYDHMTTVALMEFEGMKPPEIFTAWKSHLQNSARQDTYQDYTKMKEFIETRREELYKELTTKLNSTLNDINTDRQSKGEPTWTMAEWMNTKRDSDANNVVFTPSIQIHGNARKEFLEHFDKLYQTHNAQRVREYEQLPEPKRPQKRNNSPNAPNGSEEQSLSHSYMHTYMHSFIHSFINSFIHTNIHTYSCCWSGLSVT